MSNDTDIAKPVTHQADLSKLPRALAPLIERPQWAIWRWTRKPGGGWQKPPFQAMRPDRHASTTDPSTWADYATALAAVQAGHGDGITYVLTQQDGLAALDLDHCRDVITGSVEPWAQLMLEQALGTYVEITPSGEGLRIWGIGSGDSLNRKFELDTGDKHAVELFRGTNKALTISGLDLHQGRSLGGVDRLMDWAVFFGEKHKPAPKAAANPTHINGGDGGFPYSIDEIEAMVSTSELPPETNRSNMFHSIIGHYTGCGWPIERIFEHLYQFPNGIGERYIAGGRLSLEISRSFRKWSSLPSLSGDELKTWTAQWMDGGSEAKAPPVQPQADPELDDEIPEQKFSNPEPSSWEDDSELDDDIDGLVDDEFGEQPPPRETKLPWPVLDAAAYYGLAGDAVNAIAPHSEADPVALLIQFLAVAGNIIGRRFYYQVESDHHHSNLSVVLVGQSSKARKGTSFGRVAATAKVADPQWETDRNKTGLSSGEGLINEVRDEVKKWSAKQGAWEVVDPGVIDKRLMVVEPEFAGALAVMERHGNTLSPVLRKAWDGGRLATMTRSSSLVATGAHISIVGHITETELRARLTRTDAANGFANRFLFPLVRRSKELPFGGDLTDSGIRRIGEGIQEALMRLRTDIPRITMTDDAKAEWARVYSALSSDKPGMFGAVTARAEAQTVRLAMLYALLDGEVQIGLDHLNAGLAIWNYCEASARHIFGDATGDAVTDEITRALRGAGSAGLTRNTIRDLFSRHESSGRIGAVLADLLARGVVRSETQHTGGRPIETWFIRD